MSSEENKKLAAVITAAGLSSRMGDFKPLLPFGEGSIISRCVDNMKQAGAGEIIVVAGHRAEELKAHLAGSGCKVVINTRYAESHMFDSLCIGLRALEDGCGRVLISPVDVPAAKAIVNFPEFLGQTAIRRTIAYIHRPQLLLTLRHEVSEAVLIIKNRRIT